MANRKLLFFWAVLLIAGEVLYQVAQYGTASSAPTSRRRTGAGRCLRSTARV
jgi:hypothetical protein